MERTADDADDAASRQGLFHLDLDIETTLQVRRRLRILLIPRSNQRWVKLKCLRNKQLLPNYIHCFAPFVPIVSPD